ncbi:probable serine/threonine-protein kinase MARK-A [Argiope bruennichi]|uniref:probable serine/threonine-protein kinase MARK-A n=1 Tax=Argiope bruennichi TaxID=94029 RepID=UPI0024941E84|nr:probable serine/threonine-protein kinase MARK-A [Argiope bruennichi]
MASNQRLQHRFLVLRKLGQGTYGKVQLALNKETNQEVAIKTIKKAKIENEEDMLRIRREIHIMTSIRHPHIIHIHEVFETRQKIVIVMQYASGGELYDYLGCHETLPDSEARRLFRQIASAIYYCHKNKICHRDLKLENILLDDQGNAQIADFGLSNIFDDRRRMNTFCGSPLYAPPEIVKGLPYKGPEVDCWSLGVLLYTLIYGTMPFDGRNFKELVTQISEGRYEEPVSKSNASGLIRRLLTPDISRRATIYDICKDSWVNQGYAESLSIVAEKMALEAVLKTKNLRVAHLVSQPNNTKNGSKQLISQKDTAQQKEKHSVTNNGHSDILSSINDQISQKTSLHEQILNYDVSFIINKLLVAVESALKTSSAENNTQMTKLPMNELIHPALKSWPKNGENNLASKVDSAYVIPIFEVTSVVPKISAKMKKNLNNKETTQNTILNGSATHKMETHLQTDIKNKELTEEKKEILNHTITTGAEVSLNLQKELTNPATVSENSQNMETSKPNNQNDVNDQCLQVKKNHQENMLHRNPSVKMKTSLENQLFGQKHFGLFFRGKNNALSLARIFSMKYEKRPSVKSSNPKKKPPGKIEIPPTFDPSILPTLPSATEEKKHIVLFPTVSVSENKQKIEKKIEKIKKAALNRNLILRSNSTNRLKIQKYLKSFQAKKIQDMVCEEQRSINNSTEHMINFPETYFGNLLNAKMHNKKMNFATENGLDINFQFNGLDTESNCGFLMLAKSKSDIQFPVHVSNCSTAYNNYLNKNFSSFLCVPNSECTTKLSRSVSDSEGLNNYKNMMMSEVNTEDFKVLETMENIPSIKIETSTQGTSSYGSSETCEKENIYQNEPVFKYLNFSRNGISIEQCKEYLLSLKASYTETGNQKSVNIPNIHDATNVHKVNGIDAFHEQNISSNLSENRTLNYENNNNDVSLYDDVFNAVNGFPLTTETNNCDSNQKGVRRRNTFSCVQDCGDIVMHAIEQMRGKSVDSCSEFDDYIRISQSEQELQFSRSKDETKFSSSPNLCGLPASKRPNFKWFDENASITNHNMRNDNLINSICEDTPTDSSQTKEKSDFLKRILQASGPSNDLSSRRFNRTGNSIIGEDSYIYNENSEFLNERRLPFQQPNKSQFLSKFLNDLENKTNTNVVNGNQSPRRYTRNIFAPGKRSKLEKRSKSFLQLLSLKRIQEAEKEIERVEREVKMDEEENAGSLLEALKTHGYKGVLSQRFQGTEDNSTDTFNLYHSKSPFLRRKFSTEFPRFNSMYYDNLTQFAVPTYEMNDLDMLNGFSLRPLEMYPDFRQNSQKQFVSDWLAATRENEEFFTPQNVEPDLSYSESDNHNATKEIENESSFGKESSRSFEDETSSSESLDTPKDITKSTLANESNKIRDYIGDNSILPNYKRGERNQVRRTSSTSEDETGESVQDRIWRKSFYSRFNNSALSRKERSGFIDLPFLPESRAGFSGSLSPFKVTYRDGTDVMKTNGYDHDPQSKRIHATKKYSSTNENGSTEFVKVKPSKFSRSISVERTENTEMEAKFDDTEPEH